MDEIFYKTDEYGQSKVIPQLKSIFSACTLTFDQHYDDSCVVDIFFTATTSSGIEYKYAAECKDRWYKHSFSDDWYIEQKKFNNLMKVREDGYKPLYINTYEDDWINIWDITKCTVTEEHKTLKKSTVVDRGKINRTIYCLNTKDAVYSDKLLRP